MLLLRCAPVLGIPISLAMMMMFFMGCDETAPGEETGAHVPCQSDDDCLRSDYCDASTQTCQPLPQGTPKPEATPLKCASDDDCLRKDYCDIATQTCQPIAPDDDSPPCQNGSTRMCGESNIGACTTDEQTCVDGRWSSCLAVFPGREVCDGIDNDCDGLTDYQLQRDCGTDTGACRMGVTTCNAGVWGPCKGSIEPEEEVCGDTLDNNCDGRLDEGCGSGPPMARCEPAFINAKPLDNVTLDGSNSFDPDGGELAYNWSVLVAPQGSSSTPSPEDPVDGISAFFVDLAGDYQLQLTVTDPEGLTDTCTLRIESVPTQSIHVQLVWKEDYGDVDLHLTQANVSPLGAFFDEADSPKAIWYRKTESDSWGAPGAAGDGSLDIDDTSGNGPENINIDVSPEIGTYHVGVHLFCADDSPPLSAKVRIYCNGVLKDEIPQDWTTLQRVGDFWRPAQIEWDGQDCTVTRLDLMEHAAKYCAASGVCKPGESILQCASGECSTDAQCQPFERCSGDGFYSTCVLNTLCTSDEQCGAGLRCDTGTYAGICVR